MHILTLTRGRYETHAYLVSDGNSSEALLLDPVEQGEQFVGEAEQHGLRIIAIVATHSHFDHIGGAAQAHQRLQVPFVIGAHAVESLRAERQRVAAYSPPILIPEPPAHDRLLQEGDQLEVGALRFTVLETPGHWHGDISLYEPEQQVVFSGDTLGRD